MRLIFNPSARVRERCPSRVGFDSVGGVSAAVLVLSAFDLLAGCFAAAAAAPAEAFAAGAGLFSELTETVSPAAGRGFASVLSDSAFAFFAAALDAEAAGVVALATSFLLAVATGFA